MQLVLALALALLSSSAACLAQTPAARITILEGDVQVIRGARAAAAVLGLALNDGDIVHTPAGSTLVRIEFSDQVMLDLGPATRVLLRPQLRPPAAGRGAHVYVLAGFAKLSAAQAKATVLLSPQLEVATTKVSLVQVAVAANEAERKTLVFADTGEVRVTPRRVSAAALVVKPGQLLSAGEGAAPQVADRPPTLWLQNVPAALRDNLPSRAARFADAKVALGAQKEIGYDQAQPWLSAEAALRSAQMPRWTARARDPAFKAALVSHMQDHPEWDRALFPEKYRPKPAAISPTTRP
jgi:hypothetical protein